MASLGCAGAGDAPENACGDALKLRALLPVHLPKRKEVETKAWTGLRYRYLTEQKRSVVNPLLSVRLAGYARLYQFPRKI